MEERASRRALNAAARDLPTLGPASGPRPGFFLGLSLENWRKRVHEREGFYGHCEYGNGGRSAGLGFRAVLCAARVELGEFVAGLR